jgi:5-carboxymethyl-2-hydroxymuconate isomerase
MPGIRVRAFKADHVSMADGDPKHGYIDVMIKLRGGRPMDRKKHATNHVFAALEAFMAPHMANRSIALSLEMRDIDPELSPKSGNIRDHLGG